MLILTRRVNESLKLGEAGEITIKLLNVRGNEVKFGITAPRNVPVNREEVFNRIMEEKQCALEQEESIRH